MEDDDGKCICGGIQGFGALVVNKHPLASTATTATTTSTAATTPTTTATRKPMAASNTTEIDCSHLDNKCPRGFITSVKNGKCVCKRFKMPTRRLRLRGRRRPRL